MQTAGAETWYQNEENMSMKGEAGDDDMSRFLSLAIRGHRGGLFFQSSEVTTNQIKNDLHK